MLNESDSSPTDLETTPSNRSRAGLFHFDTEATYSAEPLASPRKQMKRTITVSMDCQPCSSPVKRQNKQRAQELAQDPRAKKLESTGVGEAIPSPKRALAAGFAESFRAVFAAFLWHEGLVHDAMACATYLKFHPLLPKRNALTFATDEMHQDVHLSREQRARQRYSVEVANAGNYLNIRPSTLETLNKSGQSSILNRRNRKVNVDVSSVAPLHLSQTVKSFLLQSQLTSPDISKLDSVPEMPVPCPPALRCLVFLWEQITANCIQMAQTNGRDDNETHVKDIVLIDDNPLEEFELRKNNHKKGSQRKRYDFLFLFSSFHL